jgi:uncharacterized repeat protein (TIGR01451 family)
VRRGQAFGYEIVVRNGGPATAYQVRVEEIISAQARYVSVAPTPSMQRGQMVWEVGTLAAGAERRIRLQVEPVGEAEIVSLARATFSVSSGLRTRVSKPEVRVAAVAPEVAQVGDSVALSLQVSNTGNGPATRVLLRAQLPEGLRHQAGAYIEAEIGTLGAGQTRSVVLQMQAVRPGSYVPQLTVLAEECPPSTVQVAVLVAEPALEAHVSGPGRALADQEIEYRLEASNTGTAPATGLRLSCGLPQGLEFVAAGSGGVLNPTARTVEWNPGTLAPGQAVAVALRVRARSAGEWVLPVFVQGDRQTVARASTPIRIDGMPGLTVEVVDQDDPIEVGAETTYTVRVRNQGSGPCTNLALAATVPAGMVPVRAEGPSAYVVQRQEIVFAALPQLAAQADAVYRVRVQGHRPGDWRFQARVTCDQYQRPVVKEEGTHVYSD